jgi:ferredoxin
LEREQSMRVIVDYEKCIASGDCVASCPEVFRQDDDGNVVLLNEEPPEELRPTVEQAVDSCPAACLDIDG